MKSIESEQLEGRSDTSAPQPTPYFTRHESVRQSRGQIAILIDAICVLMVIALINGFLVACQINIKEAPMNGGGSSYIATAPCNENWQRLHPELTKLVQELPGSQAAAMLLLLLLLLTLGTPIFAVPLCLIVRVWWVRRHTGHAIVLAIALVAMLALFPWLEPAIRVLAD